jgi:hypothetical protein
MVCECVFEMCDRSVDVTMDEYLLPDHFIGDIQRIVHESSVAMVAKREGMRADAPRDESRTVVDRFAPRHRASRIERALALTQRLARALALTQQLAGM